MSSYSVSSSGGKVARFHDLRTPEQVLKAREKNPVAHMNIDVGRTGDNVVLVGCDSVRSAFNQAFSSAVEEYNAGQRAKGKPSRQIVDYYQKCRDDKKLREFIAEDVIQIGSRDHRPSDEDCEVMLREYFEDWKRENPNLHVLYAVIHMDEETPHMHLCYCGMTKSSRGLSLRTGFTPAFQAQYGKSAKGDKTGRQKHHDSDMSLLESVLERHGHTRKVMHNDRKHLSVDEFKEIAEREQKVAEREKACELREQAITRREVELGIMADSLEKRRVELEDGLRDVDDERQRLSDSIKPQVEDVLESVPTAACAGRGGLMPVNFLKVWNALVVDCFQEVVGRISDVLARRGSVDLQPAREAAKPQLLDELKLDVNPADFNALTQSGQDITPEPM